jgi:hypothetical protein
MLFFAIILVQNVRHNSMSGVAGFRVSLYDVAVHSKYCTSFDPNPPSTMELIMLFTECPPKKHTLKMKSSAPSLVLVTKHNDLHILGNHVLMGFRIYFCHVLFV